MNETIPTFEEMRVRLLPVWDQDENKEMIVWAGIFGSVGRGRARKESDVDIVLLMKEGDTGEPLYLDRDLEDACGRNLSYLPIWRDPSMGSWMWGHVRIEALLSARTVFGDRRDVEHLRQEGLEVLTQALITYQKMQDAVTVIKRCVSQAGNFETFSAPPSQSLRRDCLDALKRLIQFHDLKGNDPIRTMLLAPAFEEADKLRLLFASQPPSFEDGDAPVWAEIWARLEPGDRAIWCWDVGSRNAIPYIEHMRASARLAEQFETGGDVDDSFYVGIVRN